MPENQAAWLTAAGTSSLSIKSTPYTPAREGEIVIQNHAVAINPVDWLIQDHGTKLGFIWLKYPLILGEDVAGEVVEVGPDVSRFKVGDHVFGQAVGLEQKRNTPAEGAFQIYTVLLAHMTSPIPGNLSYEEASVLPLCLSTAACGLFQKDQLGFQLPTLHPKPTGKTLLVWGGSTSVGSNAIQLAVAAGYEVFTTASPKNFEYVKKLGASQAFDYKSKTVVADLINAFQGRTIAGAMSIGNGAADACFDVLDKCNGDKFLSLASIPITLGPPGYVGLAKTVYAFASWSIGAAFKSRARGIRYNFIVSTSLIHDGLGSAIYENFLPEALAQKKYSAAPEPLVIGKGLENIQTGLDLHKKGVSAKKIVISL